MKTSNFLGGIAALALIGAPAALAQDDASNSAGAPPTAAEQPGADAQRGLDPVPEPAKVKLKLKGTSNKRVKVGERFRTIGRVFPWVPGQEARVVVKRGKRKLKQVTVPVRRIAGSNAGRFRMTSKRVIKPGNYRFHARKIATPEQEGAITKAPSVGVKYPDLDPGNKNKDVRLFNKLLDKQAYYTASGKRYGSATGRAVLAFRKVNNMSRTMNATPGIFKKLAAGKGGFKLKWPGGGKHIEADLSRQVMVLAKGGRARHIFHVSSGTPATPTIRGKFKTYRKDPGTNSLGMVHSVYFIRGYATHGYRSVPTYPASHGCLRNPIPNARFIYNWIDMGDVFYVYS